MGFLSKILFLAVMTLGSSLGSLYAGEVTGSGRSTRAPDKSLSICSFSGYNDLDPETGQTIYIAQSYGLELKAGTQPGPNVFREIFPGTLCNPTFSIDG